MFLDIDKISLREAFNNDNGRTSANKIVGVITSFICMILVISLTVFYFFNTGEAGTVLALIDKTIMYFGCAAGLMGVKSISSAIWRKNTGEQTYQGPIQYIDDSGQPITTRRQLKRRTVKKQQAQQVQPQVHANDQEVILPDEPEECD